MTYHFDGRIAAMYGVDEAGLSEGCEMLLLSTMNGETRVGPLYNFSGYEIGEGNG